MKVQCSNCNTTYRIPDERVPASGGAIKVRCKKCGAVMDVQGSGPTGAPATQERWFVAVGNDKQGPMSREQVLAMVRTGEIGRETYVWRKGFQEWVRLGDVPELAASLSRTLAFEAAPVPEGPKQDQRETSSETEPTVMEPLPAGGVFRRQTESEAASARAEAAKPAGVSPGAQLAVGAPESSQDEESQTKMIWQRRETSVLFSLDDYKTRRKTRTTKAVPVPAPVQVEPIARGPEEAPPREETARAKVIRLEEAEVKRVAEALSRRQRRRLLVRNVALGAGGLGLLAVVAYVMVTHLGGEEPAPVREDTARPAPVAPPPAAVAPRGPEPAVQPAPVPPTPVPAQQEERRADTPKEPPKKESAPVAKGATKAGPKPPRSEPPATAPAREPAAPPAPKPGTEDVNALLANLRSGQGGATAGSGERGGQAGGDSGEALPEQLTTGQIQSVLRKQQKAVEECIRKAGVAPGTTVTVNTRVEIEGSGRVSSASVSNAGAAEGCIRSVLSGLRFPRFRGPNMAVPYPFRVNL